MIRDITGTGEGNGPWIMIHDGFENFVPWRGFMSGSDRLAMDQHNYLVFTEPNNDAPGYAATRPCNYWGAGFNSSMRNFGLTVSGEWCLAINDCGQYLNNVGNGARYDGTYIAPGRSVSVLIRDGELLPVLTCLKCSLMSCSPLNSKP